MTNSSPYPTKLRLTNRAVDALAGQPDNVRARRYWDSEFPGLYLQFSRKGVASYCLRYTKLDGRDGDFTIGQAGIISAENARLSAKERMSALTLHGIDPVDARRAIRQEARSREDTTFGGIAEAFIAAKSKSREGKEPLEEVFFLRRYVIPRLGKIEITQINQQMVVQVVEEVQCDIARRAERKNANGKQTANGCHKAIRRIYRWAIAGDKATKNPADFPLLFPIKIKKRRGRLDEQRFASYWNALVENYRSSERTVVPLAIMIYMVTLQRPIDIARAYCSQFDFDKRTWIIPEGETKTGAEYFIPLSDLAAALIQKAFSLHNSDWLFPKSFRKEGRMCEASMTNAWRRARIALSGRGEVTDLDIELYDCRRFGRTQIRHKLKFDKDVAEAVINHHDAGRMDTRYDVFDFDDQVRCAQNAWSSEIMKMVGIDNAETFAATL